MSASTKVVIAFVAALVLAAVLGVVHWLRTTSNPAADIANTPLGDAVKNALVPEEQRREYIKKFVTVEELAIGPDLKPGEDGGLSSEPVPGLLRVTGHVNNKGEQQIDKVVLVVHPLTNTNDVLGTYVESIVNKSPLGPGERRAFKFEIPEKKGFEGRFLHDLR
jgi:hypothetical protein